MASSASPRVLLICGSVALGFSFLAFPPPSAARTSTPDISRLLAEAKRGSIEKQVQLAGVYFAGLGVPQDEKLAAYWYEKAANAGDAWAQNQIGYFRQMGIGVPRDPALAVRWYERAIAGGLVTAKLNLAVAYLLGDGARQDPALAADLFRQAYSQGSGTAASYLGEMYFYGKGVERDESLGIHWLEAGVKLHDARAEFQLGNVLWRGQKSPEDAKKGIRLLRESSAAGMVPAKHELGVLLMKNPVLAESADEASALLKEAAEGGEWRSSVALGLMSRDAMAGAAADPKAAYYHYRVAALQGGEEALKVVGHDLDAISAKLGPEQTAAIDANAKAWYGEHHLVLQFVGKDAGKWKQPPAYAHARPDSGVPAGQMTPMDPAGYMQSVPRRPSAN